MLAADVTFWVGSLMPLVLIGFFVFVGVLRARDRRRTTAEDADDLG